jgi:hypothetical protein
MSYKRIRNKGPSRKPKKVKVRRVKVSQPPPAKIQAAKI